MLVIFEDFEGLEFFVCADEVEEGVCLPCGSFAEPLEYFLEIDFLFLLGDIVGVRLVVGVVVEYVEFGGAKTGFVHAGSVGLEQSLFVVGVFEDVACGFAVACRVHYVRVGKSVCIEVILIQMAKDFKTLLITLFYI